MATATKKATTIYNVTLTLNHNEAETLLALTGKIGGDPNTSRRRFIDSIRHALREAGVNAVYPEYDPVFKDAIWFGTEDVKDNA